jgi:hypothetical protein
MERRHDERREFTAAQEFPLLTAAGLIVKDRRTQPDRRLNNIEVTYLELAAGAFQVA